METLLGAESKLNKENEEITIVIEGLHRPTGPFSICELERAKSKIVEGKAAGPDNIPPEVIKRFDLDDIILDFANSLLIRGDKPNQWSSSNIIPIVDKLTNRLILNKIQPVLDQHLRPNQNGFRSTTSQILLSSPKTY